MIGTIGFWILAVVIGIAFMIGFIWVGAKIINLIYDVLIKRMLKNDVLAAFVWGIVAGAAIWGLISDAANICYY